MTITTYGDLIAHVAHHPGGLTMKQLATSCGATYGTTSYRVGKLVAATVLTIEDRLVTAAHEDVETMLALAADAGMPGRRPLDRGAWAAMKRQEAGDKPRPNGRTASAVSRLEGLVDRLEAVVEGLE